MSGAGQEMTLDQYVAKLPESHRARVELEKFRKEFGQAKMESAVCMDLHKSLGVEWGDDPYAVIKKLREHEVGLTKARNFAALCMDPITFEKFDEALGVAVEQAKNAEDLLVEERARVAVLEGEVHVAAGMLSTTGDWASKHPEEALAFIRKSAAEIVAKDKSYEDEMNPAEPFCGEVGPTLSGGRQLVLQAIVAYKVRLVSTLDLDTVECTDDKLPPIMEKKMRVGHRFAFDRGQQIADLMNAEVDVEVAWDRADEMPDWDELKECEFHIEPDRDASYELVKEIEDKAPDCAVMVWGGNNLNMLREFVKPHKVSQADLVGHIDGVEGAEMLVPGTRIINEAGVISVGGPTQQDDTLMCCHIDCTEPADYEIVSGPAPDDYTHACVKHVGDLLGDAHEHRIHSIADATAVKAAEARVVEGAR